MRSRVAWNTYYESVGRWTWWRLIGKTMSLRYLNINIYKLISKYNWKSFMSLPLDMSLEKQKFSMCDIWSLVVAVCCFLEWSEVLTCFLSKKLWAIFSMTRLSTMSSYHEVNILCKNVHDDSHTHHVPHIKTDVIYMRYASWFMKMTMIWI